MRRQELHRLGLILPLILAVGCSGSSFTGGSGKNGGGNKRGAGDGDKNTIEEPVDRDGDGIPDPPLKPGEQPQRKTQAFQVGLFKPGVDIVWAIDNSGSMVAEAAQVQKNFKSFIGHIKGFSDVKFAVISCIDGPRTDGTCLTTASLNATGLPIEKVNYEVGSTNPMAMTLAAICPASETTIDLGSVTGGGSTKICGYTPSEAGTPFGAFLETFNPGAAGKLDKFFRPFSRKLFFAVTDDEARGIKGAQFDEYASKKFAASGYEYWGFVGLPDSDCIDNVSSEYTSLANKTGGKTFDLCQSDWSGNFGAIGSDIEKTAKRTFIVDSEHADVKILSVSVNKSELDPSKYTVAGGSVTIHHDVPLADGDVVTIVYE